MSERLLPVYKIEENDVNKLVSNFAYFNGMPFGFYLLSFNNKEIHVRCSNHVTNITRIELNQLQRSFLNTSFNDQIKITPWNPPILKHVICSVKSKDSFTDEVSFKTYLVTSKILMTVGMEYSYRSLNHRFTVIDISENGGIVGPGTQVILGNNLKVPSIEKKSKVDFDFNRLGIGGLKDELDTLFRRIFLMRMFPPQTLSNLGIKPSKGVIMHGAPGTGKTLIARNIGKCLDCVISVINGPEILNKYVGESESNLRKPFIAAKEDPDNLHLIIFDEIDSICRKRGSNSSSTGDGLVNQLLTLLDGVEEIDNILVVGMTNRLDMIDEALLRPGRFEAKIHIPLPKYEDRIDIIKIQTEKLFNSGSLKELDISKLAQETEDFSGAEISGLVRNAVSFAASRNCIDGKITSENITILEEDFYKALLDFMKQRHDYPIFDIESIKLPQKPIVSILILGEINTGKTSLAQNLAYRISKHRTVKTIDNLSINRKDKDSNILDIYSSIKCCSSSALIIDNLEIIIEYNSLTSFNNLAYQAILTMLRDKPGSKSNDHPTIMLIVTSSDIEMVNRLNMSRHFDVIVKLGSNFTYV